MANPTSFVNLVTFAPSSGGAALFMRPDSDWVWTSGVKPSVFVAVAPWSEFDKLPADLADVRGSLQLFFGSDQAADVELKQWALVDVQPLGFRQIEGGALRFFEYRLSFADRRDRFRFPFGGSLNYGEINKQPLSKDGIRDANGHHVVRRFDMATLCLKAMGIDGEVTIPHALGDAPPRFNVDWRGNPASDELATTLEEVGYTFCVKADGSFTIEQVGKGDAPTPAAGRAYVDAPLPGVDRRGTAVVFSSAPLAVIETRTYQVDDFEFVISDGTTEGWTTYDQSPLLKGFDPVDIVQNAFGIGGTSHFAGPHLNFERWRRYLYCAIRLKADKYGPQPMSRIAFDTGTAIQTEIKVFGKWIDFAPYGSAVQHETEIPPTQLLGNGTVLLLPYLLGTLGDPGLSLQTYKPPNAKGDFTVTLRREVYDEHPEDSQLLGGAGASGTDLYGATNPWRPRFHRIGYYKSAAGGGGGGGLTKMTDAQIDQYLANERTGYLPHPEIRLEQLEGEPQNKTYVESVARALADKYIGTAGDPPKVGRAAGYVAAEMGGRVNQVTFGFSPPRTEWVENAWFFPGIESLRRDAPPSQARELFPLAGKTQPQRAAQGIASGQQPVVPLTLKDAPREIAPVILVSVYKLDDGAGGKYYGHPLTGRLGITEAGGLVMPGTMQPGAEDILLLNLLEDKKATHWLLYTRGYECRIIDQLPANPDGTPGLRVGVISVPNPSETFLCSLTVAGGDNPNYTYDWKSLQGDLLATGRAPQQGRPIAGRISEPATAGLGVFDNEGNFQPVFAFETAAFGNCPDGGGGG